MTTRRRFLRSIGAAAITAPVAVITSTNPAQGASRPGSEAAPAPMQRVAGPVIIRDNAIVKDVAFPEGTAVVLDGENINFLDNYITGGALLMTERCKSVTVVRNWLQA